jgi:hypothetical protein
MPHAWIGVESLASSFAAKGSLTRFPIVPRFRLSTVEFW